jgi:hypothetical protein
LITQITPYWIDVGWSSIPFTCIAIVVYYDYGSPGLLHVDSVQVIPDPNQFSANYWVSNYVSSAPYGDGYIITPENIVGSYIDEEYAEIHGGGSDDTGGVIIGAMNREASGQIYLYGSISSTEWTHIYVYVSYDGENDWVQTCDEIISDNSLHWIDGGYYGNNFRYIAIAAVTYDGAVADLIVDYVRVF